MVLFLFIFIHSVSQFHYSIFNYHYRRLRRRLCRSNLTDDRHQILIECFFFRCYADNILLNLTQGVRFAIKNYKPISHKTFFFLLKLIS